MNDDMTWTDILLVCSKVNDLSEWEQKFIASLAEKLDMGELWTSGEKDTLSTVYFEKVLNGED